MTCKYIHVSLLHSSCGCILSYLVGKEEAAISPHSRGTKVAAHYSLSVPAGEERQVYLRLTDEASKPATEPFGVPFEEMFQCRLEEADDFYKGITSGDLGPNQKLISRQAYAGPVSPPLSLSFCLLSLSLSLSLSPSSSPSLSPFLSLFLLLPLPHPLTLCALTGLLWSKQFYHYIVESWLEGDPEHPNPPESRRWGRNAQEWIHLFNRDIISMPDKWEYPWVSQ